MKKTWVIAQAKFISLVLIASFVSNATANDQPRKPKQVFDQVCAHCHTGSNAVGPPITIAFPESVHDARSDYMRAVVRRGRNAMPAFRHSEISDAELDALLEALMSGELSPQNTEK